MKYTCGQYHQGMISAKNQQNICIISDHLLLLGSGRKIWTETQKYRFLFEFYSQGYCFAIFHENFIFR